MVFLVHELPAWTRNLTARVVKRPKLHVAGTGLAAALINVDPEALRPATAVAAGTLLETFAANEVARQLSASGEPLHLHHYRDSAGHEIDLVIERADGAVVAVEIKATASPGTDHLKHLASTPHPSTPSGTQPRPTTTDQSSGPAPSARYRRSGPSGTAGGRRRSPSVSILQEAGRVGERIRCMRARPRPERPVGAANESGRHHAPTRRVAPTRARSNRAPARANGGSRDCHGRRSCHPGGGGGRRWLPARHEGGEHPATGTGSTWPRCPSADRQRSG